MAFKKNVILTLKMNPKWTLQDYQIEEKSPSPSFNCLTPAGSNQVGVNKYEDRFEQLENFDNLPRLILSKILLIRS